MNQSTALNILKAGKNVFLTGSAGAGKTYTLNQYIQYLKLRKVPVAVTASTGIAATHMNGMTIHTWAGIGIKDQLNSNDLKSLKERKYLRDHIEKTKVLIIDEVSMLHARQLNLVNQVLKYFKETDEAFGGIQVIVAGDFFQLPPVGKPDETNRDKFAFMSEAWLEANFNICYLTEQHRQQDNDLNIILNELRAGQVSARSTELLKKTREQALEADITRLFTHNMDVDGINQQHLDSIPAKAKIFTAEVNGNDKLVMTLKSAVRAPEELVLKKDAKVMFVKNNFDNGYINGTLGVISDFVKDEDYGWLPEVTLRDGSTLIVEPETWAVENESGKPIASFKQIPLRLAWAITVHKSQGMTLEAAEIDLTQTFEKGQGYVALSRLKSLEGLRLLGLNQNALELDRLAMKADLRFQELSEEAEQEWLGLDASSQHTAFIRYCDGLVNPAEISKNQKRMAEKKGNNTSQTTLDNTKALFAKDLSVKDIADQRGLTQGTIIGHLAKLKEQDDAFDISRIKPDEQHLADINVVYQQLKKENSAASFSEDGSIKLKALFDALGTQHSYNDLRLALLFINSEPA